jgi:hypothetical protein
MGPQSHRSLNFGNLWTPTWESQEVGNAHLTWHGSLMNMHSNRVMLKKRRDSLYEIRQHNSWICKDHIT